MELAPLCKRGTHRVNNELTLRFIARCRCGGVFSVCWPALNLSRPRIPAFRRSGVPATISTLRYEIEPLRTYICTYKRNFYRGKLLSAGGVNERTGNLFLSRVYINIGQSAAALWAMRRHSVRAKMPTPRRPKKSLAAGLLVL